MPYEFQKRILTSRIAAIQGETPSNSSDENLGEKDLEKADDAADSRKADEPEKEEQKVKDPNLVEWNGPDDPENPQNWPNGKKWRVTMALAFMTFCVTFASSVFSNATVAVAELYGVSTEVSTLGTSLFVLGYAFGPLVSNSSPRFGKYTNQFCRSGVLDQSSLDESGHYSSATFVLPFFRFLSLLPKIYTRSCSAVSSAACLHLHLSPLLVVLWQTSGDLLKEGLPSVHSLEQPL